MKEQGLNLFSFTKEIHFFLVNGRLRISGEEKEVSIHIQVSVTGCCQRTECKRARRTTANAW